MTKKECPVCLILNKDSAFGDYINSCLKKDFKISDIATELINNNYSVPSNYYLKEHKINCLNDFVIPISKKPMHLIDNKNVKKIEIVDIEINWNSFDSLSFAEKDSKYHEILNRIYYSQLISLDDKKPKVSKDDITILKTLNDLIYTNSLNVSDIDISVFENETSRNKLEVLGLDLMQGLLKKGIIDPKYALEIVKLNLKNILDLDCWNPKYKVKEETPEEKAAKIEEIKLFTQWKNERARKLKEAENNRTIESCEELN